MNEEFEFETLDEQPSLLETEEAEFRRNVSIVRDHRSVVTPGAGVRWQPPVRTSTRWPATPISRPVIRPAYTTQPAFRPAYRSWPGVRPGYTPYSRPGYTPWSYTRPGYTPWSYTRPGYSQWSYTRPGYAARPPYWRQPAQWRSGYPNAPWYWQRRNPFAPGQGTRDEQIRWVQYFLNRVLNQNLPVDGVMSPATRTAVRNFQQRYGLPITGYVGPDTQQTMVAMTSADSGMQMDPGGDMPDAGGANQGVDASDAPGGVAVGAIPQIPPGADAHELLAEYGLPSGEFELESEFENWESELHSARSRGRGDCHCHQPQADSGAYEFEGDNLDRESFELEHSPIDPEEVIVRGLPVKFRRDFDKFRLEVARGIGRWTIYRSDQGRRALKLATDNDQALRALHSDLLRAGLADGSTVPVAADFIYQGRGPGRHVKRVEMNGALYGGEERIEIHDTAP